MVSLISAAESGWIPDTLVRAGIRRLVRQRLREELRIADEVKTQRLVQLHDSAIALHTDEANAQHYEVPTEFFQQVLGPRLKYSACIYPDEARALTGHLDSSQGLADAEEFTLALYASRMGIAAGDAILDLGCGWGSFSLWMAARDPSVHVTAVSNSSTQRLYIEQEARRRGIENLVVLTQDANLLDLPDDSFDKVISVEMFEHVRNYAELLKKISAWLKPEGILFTHIFCHKKLLYPFETEGDDNWMGRYFFTGGLMPAADTLTHFQDDLVLDAQWQHDGTHYQRTARAWLDNLDRHSGQVLECLQRAYGADHARVWLQRWRMFFMACEELFGYDSGNQWQIAHYRFRNEA